MPELLIELFSEEIPARMQARAAEDLKRLVTEGLKAAGLSFGDARAYATPRRLALVVEGLPERTADLKEERRGPRADAPEKAIAGFTGSLPPGTPVEARETPKGNFLFAVVETAGRQTAEVLPPMVMGAIAGMPWPKSMRWRRSALTWVRPLQRVLAVFDGKPLALDIPLGLRGGAREGDVEDDRIAVSDITSGHRFLAPAPFAATSFADYRQKLADAFVILDPAERRAKIAAGLAAAAEAEGLRLKEDAGLLDEVTGLVEWPCVLVGRIDERFMDVPPEVLTTSMRTHQKYFALLTADGRLAPRFAVVANTDRERARANIVAGNERVLRARLSDAKFFWDQDRMQRLGDRVPRLGGITFHEKLGSVGDKVDRIEALAAHVAAHVPGAASAPVRAAARLAKADLLTGLVGEFPELQGLMGRYYALHDGEDAAVADAVAEHYAPQGPNDRCPTAPVSVAVALADKIDTLVGFWAIGETPTGSRDPYALRRAALGVIRIVLENRLRLPLRAVFAAAAAGHGARGAEFDADALMAFFADRLKVHLREAGVRHDLVAAVFALSGEDDLVRLMARVDALAAFVATEDGANLLAAYRRAANILRIEEKKDGAAHDGAPDPARFAQDEERALAAAMAKAVPAAEAALGAEDFTAAMAALAGLRGPLDAFFDKVTVNAEDAALRANRLRLLSGIRRTMETVADFGQIEG